ncbi:MAG TPA: DUF389 domain-containing protein, partial [Thiomicrospira sp.]|nr:DUF389 domain-containing protein [Thiomicrospira sp.]
MQDFPGYVVLFDGEEQALFESSILPHLQEGWITAPFQGFDKDTLPQQSHVLLWLGDEDLYEAIPIAQAQNWSVGFLPHPEMNRIYRSFSVPKKIEDAIIDITATQTPIATDLLYCNDKLVLSSVMLGNPDIMSPAANMDNSIWTRFKYLALMMTRLNKVSLSPYTLETAKGSSVNTAALGMACVYRPKSSDFTKHLISDDEMDKTTLNTIILAPRSISETLRFLFSRLFPKIQINQGLARYIGHIKTQAITITGDESLSYSIDGQDYMDDVIMVSVKNDALNVMSQKLPKQSTLAEEKESIRVAEIPTGHTIKELINRSLPWIHHLDHDEVKETFVNLKESARISESFLVLMVLFTLLAAVGLFANSAPVIIGAMILAPLMAPIVSLSMGVLRQDSDLLFSALKTLSLGVFLALFFGALFTQMMPLHTVTSEISARLSPT